MFENNSLDEIAKFYKTDKSSDFHDYCKKYEKYLPFNRSDNLNILEIGVFRGGSLNTWSDYYFNSNILGIDIDQNCKVFEKGEKIKVEIGSQFDEKFLNYIVNQYGPFDLIIDDGSHNNQHVIFSFEKLFSAINPNGVYIVEDSCTSYWQEFGGGFRKEDSSIAYFKNIIDDVNFNGVYNLFNSWWCRKDIELINSLKKETSIRKDIESINFLNSIIIIAKF